VEQYNGAMKGKHELVRERERCGPGRESGILALWQDSTLQYYPRVRLELGNCEGKHSSNNINHDNDNDDDDDDGDDTAFLFKLWKRKF
jgi:hypothetical protein